MNSAIISSDWAGRTIAERYTLLRWLGGSAAGGVFLTEIPGSSSPRAAIKLVPAAAAHAEIREAAWAAATLSHPHLMRLFDSGPCEIDDAALFYTVTEYTDENLAQILPDRPLTAEETAEMLDPVLDALSYLHGKGFVHGHLKPSNIMVVDDRLKLSVDKLEAVGKPGMHFQPPGIHHAPECATAAIAPAADVWSLGVVVVEALTQQPPVWDPAVASEPVVPESIPQPFAEIARECLRRDPLRRCTLGDIRARLHPDLAVPLAQPITTGRTAPVRSRARMLIGAAILLILVIAFVRLQSHRSRSSPAVEGQQVPEARTDRGATRKGTVSERVMPDVPRSASSTIWGTVGVKIRVTANAKGRVSAATFESAGPSRYFANLALQAARKWRFRSARVHGRAVASVWILQFQFRNDATTVEPVEVSP